jgi:hypothetical protein
LLRSYFITKNLSILVTSFFYFLGLLNFTSLAERDRWGDPVIDGRLILEWIFKKWDVGLRTGLGWLRIRTDGGSL